MPNHLLFKQNETKELVINMLKLASTNAVQKFILKMFHVIGQLVKMTKNYSDKIFMHLWTQKYQL